MASYGPGRSQDCKVPDGSLSGLQPITSSIVQKSGIIGLHWIITETDFRSSSKVNVMFNYADETNLLGPEHSDVSLAVECSHITTWADSNYLIINLGKTKELVLHRPHHNKHDLPQSLEGTEQVQTAKLLEVTVQSSFSLVNHVDAI